MTMSDTEIPKIRVSAPEELIELVPYLIGFHPTESLVLIGFDAHTNQVQLGMRVDLPSSEVTEPELEANVIALVQALQRSQVDEVILILFTNTPEARPLRPIVDALTAALEQLHIGVLDQLVATDSHWWSMLCADIHCCPVGGSPRVKASVAATKATYAGLVARSSREDLEKVFEGEPDPERYEPALANAEQRYTEAVLINRTRTADAALCKAEARRHVDDPTRRLTVPQLARIAVALTDITVRDELWLSIDDASLDADRLLVELFTRLPQPYLAPPLFLYGWAAWRRGDGTLAGMAVERALESDPTYSAAALLQAAVTHGLDPRSTPKLREGEADDDAQH
jgi:hypothetical protein